MSSKWNQQGIWMGEWIQWTQISSIFLTFDLFYNRSRGFRLPSENFNTQVLVLKLNGQWNPFHGDPTKQNAHRIYKIYGILMRSLFIYLFLYFEIMFFITATDVKASLNLIRMTHHLVFPGNLYLAGFVCCTLFFPGHFWCYVSCDHSRQNHH